MSSDVTRRHLRAGMFGVAAFVVAAVVYWTSRPDRSVVPAEQTSEVAATASRGSPPGELRHAETGTPRADSAPTSSASTPATDDTEVATVAQYTTTKYEILFDDLRYLQPDELEQLRRALLERELVAGAIDAARQVNDAAAKAGLPRQEAALAQAEGRIRALLRPADHATYEALKESDLEQFHLNEYAGGVSNVAPLSDADRKAILRTKLAYKERFRQLVRDSGLLRKDLSPAEREYAYSITSRALQDYKRSYLQEVRQYLTNEEQYVLLSNYETTEFTTELDKLRSVASGG